MANEQQKQLLTEVMNADAKDGLYEPNKMVTAVEWLEQSIKSKVICAIYERLKDEGHFEQAMQMEKKQIENAYLQNISKGNFSHCLKSWDEAEQYYNETYGK